MTDHFVNTHPRARVAHPCHTCGRTIHPGETYRNCRGMDGATAWTSKECAHCETFAAFVMRELDYDVETYDFSTLLDYEATTLPELRAKAHLLKRWTRRDGSLYPIPQVKRTPIVGQPHGFSVQLLPAD